MIFISKLILIILAVYDLNIYQNAQIMPKSTLQEQYYVKIYPGTSSGGLFVLPKHERS